MADTKIVITAETSQAQGALQSLGSAAGALGQRLQSLPAIGGAFVPAAAIASIVSMARNAIDAADNLNDLSQKYGVAIRDLTSYKLAAEQSGTSLDGVAVGLKKLSTNLVENGAALKAAGVDTSSTTAAMRDLADMFASMPDGVEKTALALKLFGRSGADLIPMLNGGAAGLDKSAAATKRLGDLYEKLAPNADEFNDTLGELSTRASAFGVNLANKVLPALLDFIRDASRAAEAGQSLSTVMARGFGADSMTALGSKASNPWESLAKVNEEIARLESGKGGPNQNANNRRLQALKADARELNLIIAEIQKRVDAIEGGQSGVKPAGTGSKLLKNLGGGEGSAAKAAKAAQKQVQDEADAWVKAIDAQIDAEREMAQATAKSAEARYKEIESFKAIADPALKFNEQLEKLAQLREQVIDGKEFGISIDTIDKASEAIRRQRDEVGKTGEVARELGFTFNSAFEDAIVKGKSFREVLDGIFQDILRIIVRQQISEPFSRAIGGLDLGGLFGGLFGGGATGYDTGAVDLGGSIDDFLAGFRADGGPVSAGKRYVVGERGPELFVPGASGTIVPNEALSGGPVITYAPVIQIDSRADREAVRADVDAAVRRGNAELVDKLQRAGKL